jgi:hypothetical protein
LIDMRMGIGVARQPMCGPARMADPHRTVNGALVQQFRKARYPSNAFANLQAAMIEQANPGGVIAAIFEAAEAFEKQRGSVFLANISNDATHGLVIGN